MVNQFDNLSESHLPLCISYCMLYGMFNSQGCWIKGCNERQKCLVFSIYVSFLSSEPMDTYLQKADGQNTDSSEIPIS